MLICAFFLLLDVMKKVFLVFPRDFNFVRNILYQNHNPQIIVFFATAHMTSYMAQVANAVGISTLEMHSRKSQAQRDKASEAFRRVNKGTCSAISGDMVRFLGLRTVFGAMGLMSSSAVDYPVLRTQIDFYPALTHPKFITNEAISTL